MKRIILNIIVGLLSFVIGIAVTNLFVSGVATKLPAVLENNKATRCFNYKPNINEDISNNWKKVDHDLFSFYLPKDMKGKRLKVYEFDGWAYKNWIYKNSNIRLNIDFGSYLQKHIEEFTNNPSYKSEKIVIDGREAIITTWNNKEIVSDEQPLFNAAVYFPNVEGETKLTIGVRCKNKAAQEDAIKIFRSIRFKK